MCERLWGQHSTLHWVLEGLVAQVRQGGEIRAHLC